MTQYIADIVEHQGMPYTEFRYEPDIIPAEKIEICFQPRFPYDLYAYPEPEFVYGQKVALARDWDFCEENGISFEENYYFYHISALELLEDVSKDGKGLTEAPSWRYGIRGTDGTRELVWFEAEQLVDPFDTGGNDEF